MQVPILGVGRAEAPASAARACGPAESRGDASAPGSGLVAVPAYDVLSADELDELAAGLEPIAAAVSAAGG